MFELRKHKASGHRSAQEVSARDYVGEVVARSMRERERYRSIDGNAMKHEMVQAKARSTRGRREVWRREKKGSRTERSNDMGHQRGPSRVRRGARAIWIQICISRLRGEGWECEYQSERVYGRKIRTFREG